MATGADQTRRKGQEHRERMARRMRDQTASVSDIGEMPKVKNARRKKACRLDLQRFLVEYFPNSTGLSPFSADHRRVIERIQRCILEGGRFVNAVYRGFAKTTISENAAIWATAYGHRSFVPIFGSGIDSAQGNIESIKLELSENDLLYEDFPEVCHAIRALEGRPQRRLSQSYGGERTHIGWTSDRVILPTIPGSPASGAVICARGITGGFRGLKVKRPDGTQQRPDFILIDDPQTDESAATAPQVYKTLATLRKAILKLGGHRRQLAIVINATVIQLDDAIDELLRDPSWQGERIPLVRKWPDAHETLWLGEYATLRRSYDKDVVGDQERAWKRATEFYAARREAMDAGAEVSWESCFDPASERSALQHAYNALIDDGPEAFASEYQQQPTPRQAAEPGELVADEVAARANRHARGLAPAWVERLTSFIDVQQAMLWYAVCAWGDGFSGAVLDYGGWPDQGKEYFTLGAARHTLAEATGVGSLEGSLWAGLTRLAAELLGRDWPLEGRAGLRVERCLIDCGWGQTTDLVRKFCRESAHAAQLLPSKGMGFGASATPISEWAKKPGQRRGVNWLVPPRAAASGHTLIFDAHAWKSTLADRLRQPLGEPGALTLWGDDARRHRMLADHCTAEYRVKTSGRGRELHEWKLRPGRDNHLWDCLVGCAVANSERGGTLPGIPAAAARERRRVSYAEMYKQARDRR